MSCNGDISEFFIHLFFLIFPVDSLTSFFKINSFYFIHSFKERCLHHSHKKRKDSLETRAVFR